MAPLTLPPSAATGPSLLDQSSASPELCLYMDTHLVSVATCDIASRDTSLARAQSQPPPNLTDPRPPAESTAPSISENFLSHRTPLLLNN